MARFFTYSQIPKSVFPALPGIKQWHSTGIKNQPWVPKTTKQRVGGRLIHPFGMAGTIISNSDNTLLEWHAIPSSFCPSRLTPKFTIQMCEITCIKIGPGTNKMTCYPAPCQLQENEP